MAKGVFLQGARKVRPVTVTRALCGDNNAIASLFDRIFDLRYEAFAVEGNFWKEDYMRRFALLLRSEAATCCDSSGMAPHDLQNKDFSP